MQNTFFYNYKGILQHVRCVFLEIFYIKMAQKIAKTNTKIIEKVVGASTVELIMNYDHQN